MRFEIRGRCPACKTETIVWGYEVATPDAATMDALENRVDKIGSVEAHCKTCDRILDVAFFADGEQSEPWMSAIEYERRNGPAAGPLPPKPWQKKNDKTNNL